MFLRIRTAVVKYHLARSKYNMTLEYKHLYSRCLSQLWKIETDEHASESEHEDAVAEAKAELVRQDEALHELLGDEAAEDVVTEAEQQ